MKVWEVPSFFQYLLHPIIPSLPVAEAFFLIANGGEYLFRG